MSQSIECDFCERKINKVVGLKRFMLIEFDEFDRELKRKDLCAKCMSKIKFDKKKK
jgi:hypothetical protein